MGFKLNIHRATSSWQASRSNWRCFRKQQIDLHRSLMNSSVNLGRHKQQCMFLNLTLNNQNSLPYPLSFLRLSTFVNMLLRLCGYFTPVSFLLSLLEFCCLFVAWMFILVVWLIPLLYIKKENMCWLEFLGSLRICNISKHASYQTNSCLANHISWNEWLQFFFREKLYYKGIIHLKPTSNVIIYTLKSNQCMDTI